MTALRCPPGCDTARLLARERILRACELLTATEALGLLDEVRWLLTVDERVPVAEQQGDR